jgi:hypothetical protein
MPTAKTMNVIYSKERLKKNIVQILRIFANTYYGERREGQKRKELTIS